MTDFEAFEGFLSGDLKKEEDKVERALFFVGAGESVILLHAVGWMIEADVDEGLSREGEAGPWAEIPKEDGLWIWEGTPTWRRCITYEGIDEGGEPIYDGRGKARRPTEEELKTITGGSLEKLLGPSQLHKG